jgi:peptidoglycan/LPS O-acetylase OafA/YrhL
VQYNYRLNPSTKTKSTLRTLGLITYPYYLIHEAVGGYILYHLLSLHVSFFVSLPITLLSVGVIAFSIANWGEPFIRQYLKLILDFSLRAPSRDKVAPPSV